MVIEWDHDALNDLAARTVREVAARALPVMERHTQGKVWLDGADIAIDEQGTVAEYGTVDPGTHWVFPALEEIAGVNLGDH